MFSHNGEDLSTPGDSGGPVFINGKAWGITSGATWNISMFCECNNVYMPINYAESGLDVTILTQ